MSWRANVLIALGMLVPVHPFWSDEKEIVAAIRRFEQRYANIAIVADVQGFNVKGFNEEDGSIPPDRLVRRARIKFWRSGNTARAYGEFTRRTLERGRIVERVEASEKLVTPERSLGVPIDPKTGKFEGTNVIARFPKPGDNLILQLISQYELSTFLLEGRINILGPTLSEKLSAAQMAIREELLGNHRTFRIDFEDSWGLHSLWLDPEKNYQPVRVIQRKLSDHLMRPNVRMRDVPEDRRFGRTTEIETQFDVRGSRQLHGDWVVESYETQTKYLTTSSKTAEEKTVVQFKEIGAPAAIGSENLKLATAIPDGAMVVRKDEFPVLYEWQGGAIVKSVDQPLADGLARQKFQNSSRWWLWSSVLILALVVFATFLVIRKRLVTRKFST